uniref:hypothetical protein n=1 Tax=Ndongobacter massiliensis TaxID=1871025 RepID=UPI000930FA93|nr:hypothetical protein [Ndongobacter massiliensis]
MKKIRLQSNVIEIPLADEKDEVVYTFRFDKRDENVKRFDKALSEMGDLEEKMKGAGDYESARSFTKKNIDFVFGEGTFDALYKINPSLSIVSAYFLMACQYIRDELDVTREETLAKYIG